MKLTISRDLLINAISLVAKAADKHHRIGPILANIKFILKPELLTLVASDLEVELTATVKLPQGACIEAGETTLPAEKLFTICKTVSDEVMLLDASEARCLVIGGRAKYTLKTLPAQDFPSIGSPSITTWLQISRTTLHDLIAHTRFAMATQDVRHYLTGMLFEINGDQLTAVATDGHRLAVAHRSLGISHEERRVTMPGKAVGELERLLGEVGKNSEDEQVCVGFDDNFMQVSLEFDESGEYGGMQVGMVARLIEGKFPDYRRVFPSNHDKSVLFNKDELSEVLRRLSILVSKDAPGVLFNFSQNGAVKVSVNNREQDAAEESLVGSYQGEPLEISFNEAYLRAVLRVLDGDIRIEMTEAVKPALIYQVGDEMNHQYVIMPMRV
ncbi:DNA polymerase III subunit beta [Moraxella sp. Tifton1]|uniref:DNA polymerase III subunit beta n=1 Tax=Moraxella oculi TaxID=2940516 RepID=UPI0020114BE6|nr:DNA polymerase III subunit beta [Moraxella sp. Tifton1]MCL1623976.1 DNA polymerase III subunit beta [Moraxella sp. Tifton1]